jgi:hypothetical protein
MEPLTSESATPSPIAPEPSLSVIERSVAIFTRPGAAWAGLQTRAQWWFPLLLMTIVNMAFTATLWERAILPTQLSGMEQQVADGKMTSEQMDQAESMMRSPAGMALAVLPWLLLSPVISLLVALVTMLGVGFMLGGKLPYRQALEVTTWSGLVQLPALLLTAVLAWSRGTMEGVHLSLAAFLPQSDAPSTGMRIVTGILDGLGPFSIWWLAVTVIGAATLSGVPRKKVAWGLGAIYVVLMVFFAILGAMMRRGG